MKDKIELDEPPYYVLYRNQRKGTMRLDAQFLRYSEAVRYVRSYRTLKKHELVTIERRCEEDPDKVHLMFSACHKQMDVALTSEGPRAMPPEMAAVFEQCDDES